MRKYLSAAGALLLGILSVSCSEKGPSLEMEIDPMELSIAPEGGNQTFTVKSNKDWTLVADSWITPSTKGERGSEVTVTVNLVAGKNAEATARTGYVIISADGKKEKVVVTQEPFVAFTMLQIWQILPMHSKLTTRRTLTFPNGLTLTERSSFTTTLTRPHCPASRWRTCRREQFLTGRNTP